MRNPQHRIEERDWGYVCVRVDSRGARRFLGDADCFGPRETRDFAACVECAGEQRQGRPDGHSLLCDEPVAGGRVAAPAPGRDLPVRGRGRPYRDGVRQQVDAILGSNAARLIGWPLAHH